MLYIDTWQLYIIFYSPSSNPLPSPRLFSKSNTHACIWKASLSSSIYISVLHQINTRLLFKPLLYPGSQTAWSSKVSPRHTQLACPAMARGSGEDLMKSMFTFSPKWPLLSTTTPTLEVMKLTNLLHVYITFLCHHNIYSSVCLICAQEKRRQF